LDVTVHLPDGWQALSTPPLEREGATLRGSFTGLPADALLLATRAPLPPEYQGAAWLSAAIFGVTMLAGGVLCWWTGRRRGPAWTGFLCLLWAALVFLSGAVLPWALMQAALHGQHAPYFHEHFEGLFCGDTCLAVPATLLAGFAITLWSASRAARRSAVGGPRAGRP
jgi:hypothetical protein